MESTCFSRFQTDKSENDLKIRMGEEPITIVGKKLKVGDKITQVPLVVNAKLEEKNIFGDKNIKVLYTAPSLDTKVCSLQTKILNDEAKKNLVLQKKQRNSNFGEIEKLKDEYSKILNKSSNLEIEALEKEKRKKDLEIEISSKEKILNDSKI